MITFRLCCVFLAPSSVQEQAESTMISHWQFQHHLRICLEQQVKIYVYFCVVLYSRLVLYVCIIIILVFLSFFFIALTISLHIIREMLQTARNCHIKSHNYNCNGTSTVHTRYCVCCIFYYNKSNIAALLYEQNSCAQILVRLMLLMLETVRMSV